MKKLIAVIAATLFFSFLFVSTNTVYAAISGGSVTCNTPGDCVAGDTSATYDISFITNDSSPATRIQITFPNNYTFTNNALSVSAIDVNSTMVSDTFNLSGKTINIYLNTPTDLSTGTVSFSITSNNSFTNPSINGDVGNFIISTNAAGEIFEPHTPGVIITGGRWPLTYTAGTGGMISGVSSQAVLNGANGTAVTAVPNAGYTFVNWTGTTTTTQNPLTSTNVLGAISETANFEVVPTTAPILIAPTSSQSYSDGNMLTVEYTLPQTPQAGSTTLTFTPTSGSPIVLTLADALPGVQTSVSFSLANGFSTTTQIIGETASAIPDGTYSVTLTYQAIGGGEAGSATVTNVSIVPVIPPFATTPGIQQGLLSGGNPNIIWTPSTGFIYRSVPQTQIPSVTTSAAAQILNSGKCSSSFTITDNLRSGDKDGNYDRYNNQKVTQVNILQTQINRILAASYSEAAGPIDGIFGPLTKEGVERLQVALNSILAPNPALIIDGIVGPFTKNAMNNSCGKI